MGPLVGNFLEKKAQADHTEIYTFWLFKMVSKVKIMNRKGIIRN